MADTGHTTTDAALKRLEGRIRTVYKEAAKEMGQTASAYFQALTEREVNYQATLDKMVANKQMNQATADKEFKQWRLNQMARGERYEAMRDQLAERATKANEVASSYINDTTPGIYSLNRNYAAYTIEGYAGDIGFTMYDEQTVKKLIKSKPDLMPNYDPKPTSVNYGKDIAYGKKQITAAVTSSILQGKPIGSIANDLQKRITDMNRASAIRAARTAITSAENAGRLDTYYAAQDMGIDMKKQWMATLDDRTRASHGALDGETVDVKKKFSNGLMYPGDRKGAPAEVYNCRCTMISVVAGSKVGNRKTFSQWMKEKQVAAENIDKLNNLAAEKLSLADQLIDIQKELDNFNVKTYSGIWKDDVTTADIEALNINGKKTYYQGKLSYEKDPDKIKQFQEYLNQLDELESEGSKYAEILQKKREIEARAKMVDRELNHLNDPNWSAVMDMYSDERKAKAKWFRNFYQADNYYDPPSKQVHGSATRKERDGFYTYTAGSGGHNRPLAGFEKSWAEGGSGWEDRFYKGSKNVWIDFEGKGEQIRGLTTLIEKSTYDSDVWLQSGQDYATLEGFLGVPKGTLAKMDDNALQQFVGQKNRVYQFLSSAVNEGGGSIFNSKPMKFNIYCPEGSELLYASDVGAFGKGENEMILQRGGSYEITRIYRGKDATDGNRMKLFVDLDLHIEDGYDKFQQDPNEWTGSKRNYRS